MENIVQNPVERSLSLFLYQSPRTKHCPFIWTIYAFNSLAIYRVVPR